jgi:predicted site-specific integrase-resolvase
MTTITIDGIQVLTLHDAAPYIGISPASLFRWMASGKISSMLFAGRTYIQLTEADRVKKPNSRE